MAGGTGARSGGGGGGGLSANATSILCWTLLPQLLTNALVSLFYRLSPSSRPTVPPNATPRHLALAQERSQAHHRRARILLVFGYLAYSILSVYYAQSVGLEQNYYSLLGLARSAVESDPSGSNGGGSTTVKSHWRRLARKFHPDKVGKAGEAYFVRLRRGVETLENDNKRWAYERFGPDIHDWGAKLVTPREVLATGAVRSFVWWAFAFGSIIVFSFFRKSERQYNFWRYLSLFLCLALEFHLVMRPSVCPVFSALFPHRLPFEHVALLRQIFISTSMAMSQLAPVLFPPSASDTASDAGDDVSEEDAQIARALRDADALKPLLTRLTQIVNTTEAEVVALQRLELQPLLAAAGDGEDVEEVQKRLKKHMVHIFEDLQLKGNPATASAWSAAVRAGLERARTKVDSRTRTENPTVPEAPQQQNGYAKGGEATSTAVSTEPVAPHARPAPVTLLVSPPSSPKAESPSSLPDVAAVAVSRIDLAAENGGQADSKLLPLPAERRDFRLPTPPPEDLM